MMISELTVVELLEMFEKNVKFESWKDENPSLCWYSKNSNKFNYNDCLNELKRRLKENDNHR